MAVHDSLDKQSINVPVTHVAMQPLFRLVFLWMGVGLLITAAVSVFIAANDVTRELLSHEYALYGAFIIELLLVGWLGGKLNTLSVGRAVLLFTIYCAVNGFTLAVVFIVFDLDSIASAFVAAAALFGAMAVIGFTTQIDLTRFSAYLLMGLCGLVIALVLNIVIASSALQVFLSLLGVVLFTILTAHDVQKIKALACNPEIQAHGDLAVKLSILGALTLYLDLINLWLHILSLFGDSSE
jgi:uncharacterized protein